MADFSAHFPSSMLEEMFEKFPDSFSSPMEQDEELRMDVDDSGSKIKVKNLDIYDYKREDIQDTLSQMYENVQPLRDALPPFRRPCAIMLAQWLRCPNGMDVCMDEPEQDHVFCAGNGPSL